MTSEFNWRLVRERLAKGQITGVLCSSKAEGERWIAMLEAEPLLQRSGDTFFAPSGALVALHRSVETAQAWELNRGRAVLWIDDENLLDAPLPAPKPVTGK